MPRTILLARGMDPNFKLSEAVVALLYHERACYFVHISQCFLRQVCNSSRAFKLSNSFPQSFQIIRGSGFKIVYMQTECYEWAFRVETLFMWDSNSDLLFSPCMLCSRIARNPLSVIQLTSRSNAWSKSIKHLWSSSLFVSPAIYDAAMADGNVWVPSWFYLSYDETRVSRHRRGDFGSQTDRCNFHEGESEGGAVRARGLSSYSRRIQDVRVFRLEKGSMAVRQKKERQGKCCGGTVSRNDTNGRRGEMIEWHAASRSETLTRSSLHDTGHWLPFVAGGVAAVTSNLAVYPLTTLVTRIQSGRK